MDIINSTHTGTSGGGGALINTIYICMLENKGAVADGFPTENVFVFVFYSVIFFFWKSRFWRPPNFLKCASLVGPWPPTTPRLCTHNLSPRLQGLVYYNAYKIYPRIIGGVLRYVYLSKGLSD